MKTFIDQNQHIKFNNYKEATESLVVSGGPLVVSNQEGVTEFGGIINGVDIDWNNAQFEIAVKNSENRNTDGLQVKTITTTGDLLAIIAGLQAQVDNLTTLVKGLYTALTTTSTSDSPIIN